MNRKAKTTIAALAAALVFGAGAVWILGGELSAQAPHSDRVRKAVRVINFASTPGGVVTGRVMPTVAGPGLLTSLPIVDEILHGHASELGHDFIAYRNHVYRVVNLCAASAAGSVDLEKVAIAAVFHDLGIWTNKTFDYLAPSIALARKYLAARSRAGWIAEIERMIADHHKITPSHTGPDSLVEPFRRADWIDVTRGLRTFGLPRPVIGSVLARWPSAGFHRRLLQLTLERFRTHPLSPLPMVKL